MRRVIPLACLAAVVVSLGCKTTDTRRDSLADVRYDVSPTLASDAGAPATGPLYFGFDEHVLSDKARADLREVARFMAEDPEVHVTIEGHCDDLGTSEYNLALGHSRAQAARQYLTALGVEEARVKVLSFGEERPVLSGTDDEARAKNRRDELAFFSSAEAQVALDEQSSALDVVLAWNTWDAR